MLQELSDESRRMGLRMNIAKTKVMVVDNTPINVNNVLIENVPGYVRYETYGAETWTLTKQVRNKLAAAQIKMERSKLNITYKDRRTNIWVRERTKLINAVYTRIITRDIRLHGGQMPCQIAVL